MAGPPPPPLLPASTAGLPPPWLASPSLWLWLRPPMMPDRERSGCSPAEAEDSCRLRLPLVAWKHDTASHLGHAKILQTAVHCPRAHALKPDGLTSPQASLCSVRLLHPEVAAMSPAAKLPAGPPSGWLQ